MTTPLPVEGEVHDGIGGFVTTVTEHWIVAVVPMIFNDRIILIDRDVWEAVGLNGGGCAGWCYDKGGAAALAALAWNPEEQHSPVGWKKIATDSR